MTTITVDHLTRSAIVYIRQSTVYQVTNNKPTTAPAIRTFEGWTNNQPTLERTKNIE
jgi:hypothetical protein